MSQQTSKQTKPGRATRYVSLSDTPGALCLLSPPEKFGAAMQEVQLDWSEIDGYPTRNPSFATVLKVSKALGVKLHASAG